MSIESPFRKNALNTTKPISAPVFQKAFANEIPIICNDIFMYPGMNDISLFKISDRVKDLIDSNFILNKTELFDKDWVLASDKYVQGLPIADKATILGYTYEGDEYVNNYLRNPETFLTNKRVLELLQGDLKKMFANCASGNSIIVKGFPFFAQLFTKNNISIGGLFDSKGHITTLGNKKACDVLKSLDIISSTPVTNALKILIPYIEQFVLDLKRIIHAAPRLTKSLKVFRGTKTDYLKDSQQIKGFTSTTISLYVAGKSFSGYNYSNRNNNRILYEFIIDPKIPCIFLPPQNTWPGMDGKAEFEVLIDSDVIASPSSAQFRRVFNPPPTKSYINKSIINNLNIDPAKKQELLKDYMKDHNNYSYAEMISLIEFRNTGEEFKTRIISLTSKNEGGRRKTRYRKKPSNKTRKRT